MMTKLTKQILLTANGTHANLGCEAIEIGTVNILNQAFVNPEFNSIGYRSEDWDYSKSDLLNKVLVEPIDRSNTSFLSDAWSLSGFRSETKSGFRKRLFFKLNKTFPLTHLTRRFKKADIVLGLGGDNFSLDYGYPKYYLDLLEYSLYADRPFVIWGASIGQNKRLATEDQQKFFRIIKQAKAIFLRESLSYDFLEQKGFTNLHIMSDPAFTMLPTNPLAPLSIPNNCIGINFSPLMGRKLFGEESFIDESARLLKGMIQKLCKIEPFSFCFVPHVFKNNNNDFDLLRSIVNSDNFLKDRVTLIQKYSAPEMKSIIAQMRFFIGARTHSTIAAISSGVPTLSLGYSIKARGINHDIFGHEKYVVSLEDMSVDRLINSFRNVYADEFLIKKRLNEFIPGYAQSAYKAGEVLKEILSNDRS